MPKKKEPTGTPVTKEPTKSAKAEKPAAAPAAVKPAAEPAKPVEAAKPVAAKPASETTAKVAEKPAAPTPKPEPKPAPATPAPTPAPKAAAKPAAPAKTAAPVTIVVAKYDVGHGNSMFIRGEGPGLSWESGTAMKNSGNDVWVWTTSAVREGVVSFKFLINDESWAAGDNLTAQAGETTTYYPSF